MMTPQRLLDQARRGNFRSIRIREATGPPLFYTGRMTSTQNSETQTSAAQNPETFSPEERKAMRARAKELKAAAGKESDAAAHETAIAALPDDERELAERIRGMVATSAPQLDPKTYYGFPAWARDGKIVCFFKPKSKFKVRYSTFEFDTAASLDDGAVWATAFAVHNDLTESDLAMLGALVTKAAG
jgi:uncharacterized protein YdhG (YjbR/CyaY superfamily)